MSKKLNVAIIGASGYTGVELLRLLALHPHAQVVGVTSENSAGIKLQDAYPHLRSFYPQSLVLEAIGEVKGKNWPALDGLLKRAEVFFTALPHGTSTPCVQYLLNKGARVIDLSADFRLHDVKTYEAWYGKHQAPELLPEAVYGLPELYRQRLKKARLVATPGCYPTGAIMSLAPLLKNQLVDPASIIIDSKSGASGAGRGAKVENLFTEVQGGLRAYGVTKHRHTPEIEQELSALAQKPIQVTFTPHLVPMSRGILTCSYATPVKNLTAAQLHETYAAHYRDEKFVRFFGIDGALPDTRYVAGTYFCDVAVRLDERNRRIIAISAIDNLCRGASGMAVSAMNLMNGWEEELGLRQVALYP